VGGICLILTAGLVYSFIQYLRESEIFSVKWIYVEGAVVLDPQAVLAASGITTRDNLLFFDAKTAAQRVEALPYVEDCTFERIFPDTVVLTISERCPAATLLVNNRFYELDAACVAMRELAWDQVHPGPLITNVPGLATLVPGQQVALPPITAALAVWNAFASISMALDVTVSELAALGENQILMYCDELDYEIRWGRDDFAGQARRLEILWQEKNKRIGCKEYLDLRFGNDLVCK
jgi:cell division septal protein FtsQ